MKLLFLLCLFFQSISQVNALSCGGAGALGQPEHFNEYNKVATAGWGYIINTGDSNVFRFLTCYNRPSCNDLNLSKLNGYLINNSPKLYSIQSYFNSFEEGQVNDSKKKY